MEFIPESEQLFDITTRLLSLHSLFAKPGLLKSRTCVEFQIQWTPSIRTVGATCSYHSDSEFILFSSSKTKKLWETKTVINANVNMAKWGLCPARRFFIPERMLNVIGCSYRKELGQVLYISQYLLLILIQISEV